MVSVPCEPTPVVRVKTEPQESAAPPPVAVNVSPSKPLIKVRTNLGCNIQHTKESESKDGDVPRLNGELDAPSGPANTTVKKTKVKANSGCNKVSVTKESQEPVNGDAQSVPGCSRKSDTVTIEAIKIEPHFAAEDHIPDCKMEPMSPDTADGYYDRAYNLRPRTETSVNYGETMEWQENTRTSLPKPVHQKITPWKCDACLFHFTSKDAVKLHQNSVECKGYGMINFPCRLCSKLYFDERDLAEHNLKHLRIAQNLTPQECRPCPVCRLIFADQLRFKQHVKLHRKPTAPAPEWICCGKTFIKRSVYEEHLESHESPVPTEALQEDSRDFACSLCIERFKSEDLLYDHRFAMHGIPDERVACSLCLKKFRTPAALEEHAKTHELRAVARKSTAVAVNPVKIKCRRCGRNFPSRTQLVRHEAEKHKSLHNCVRCKRRFATRSLLLMHLRTHKKPKATSSLCAQYNIASDGTSDVAVPDPKQVANNVCSICDLVFGCDEDIALHLSTHNMPGICAGRIRHNMKHVYRYQCSNCPQLFLEMSSLYRHSQIRHFGTRVDLVKTKFGVKRAGFGISSYNVSGATSEVSFPCTKCSAVFPSVAVLNFHVRKKHEGLTAVPSVKTYVDCSICSKPYSSNYIHKHMLYDHGRRANKKRKDDRDYVSTRKKLFKCQYCKRSCSNSHNLKKHEESHDPATGDFKCYCGSLFKTQELIYDHKKKCGVKIERVAKKLVPAPPQVETCNVCFQSYETPQLLQLHVSTAHGLGVPTDNPSKELWREESNKIIRKVNGVLRCTLCRLRFDNNEEVSWHQGQHARGNAYIIQLDECLFQCTVCGKLFKQREDGLSHISAHAELESSTSTESLKKFNCPFCSQKFTREESIRSHIHSQHPGDSSKRTV